MLKTTNYTIAKTGEVLPEAYAMLDKQYVDKNDAQMTFGIYASREEARKYHSIERKHLKFTWDRVGNVAEIAYNLAKKKDSILAGWEDCKNVEV